MKDENVCLLHQDVAHFVEFMRTRFILQQKNVSLTLPLMLHHETESGYWGKENQNIGNATNCTQVGVTHTNTELKERKVRKMNLSLSCLVTCVTYTLQN